MDINQEESPILSLSEGRELLKNTALANLSDEELQEVLESVKTFCEMCFDHYFNRTEETKIIPLNAKINEDKQQSEAA